MPLKLKTLFLKGLMYEYISNFDFNKRDISKINSPDEWVKVFMKDCEPTIMFGNEKFTKEILTGKKDIAQNGHGTIFKEIMKNAELFNRLKNKKRIEGYTLKDGTFVSKDDVTEAWINFEEMKAELLKKEYGGGYSPSTSFTGTGYHSGGGGSHKNIYTEKDTSGDK